MLDINNMKRSDFYYDLPQELIAQTPVEPRNASRMMKINRQTGEVVHDHFYNLCNYLKKGVFLYAGGSGRVTDVGIDLHEEVAADARVRVSYAPLISF